MQNQIQSKTQSKNLNLNKMNTKKISNNSAASIVKPFCKVCFDANKPESQYTSHFVRKTKDLNSEILCPIILATECKYCHKLGHTISKCSLREKNNARHAHAMQAPVQRPMPAPVRGNNRYAVFEVEDEVEVEVEVQVNETEFPLLGGKSAAVQDTSRVSYAKAFASKPAQAPLTKPTPKNNTTKKTATTKAANYHHYYSYIEDYSCSPNLEKWLSEPSVQQEQQEELAIGEKYRDRLYEILYEYFKNEFHRERTSTVVDRLLDCSSKERLEEFMSNRLYLEDCADEIFTSLKEFDPLARTSMYREIAEDNDW